MLALAGVVALGFHHMHIAIGYRPIDLRHIPQLQFFWLFGEWGMGSQ